MVRGVTFGGPAVAVFAEGVAPGVGQSLSSVAVAGHAHAPKDQLALIQLRGRIVDERPVEAFEIESGSGREGGGESPRVERGSRPGGWREKRQKAESAQ